MRPDPDLLQRWVLDEAVPPAKVGPLLGLSRAAGYSWLRRYGITAPGPLVQQRQLVALWRAGMVAARLATELGLPPDAIRERLVTASVLRPSRSYFVVGSPDDPLPEHLLRDWYVRRFLTLRDTAFHDPRSYFHRYSLLSDEEATATAIAIWERTNLANLEDNILPTRPRATLILKKGADHVVETVALRRL